MNVLIVSKTDMRDNLHVCVGGIELPNLAPVRLLQPGENFQLCTTEFEIGQIWDIDYTRRNQVRPPHIEDVIVNKKLLVKSGIDINAFIIQSSVAVWRGSPDSLFYGCNGTTANGSLYVSERTGIPPHSTGFWIPSEDLIYNLRSRAYEYSPMLYQRLKYAGLQPPVEVIPKGTIVRVSLARWWKPSDADPDFEERCYVQLSGWY